MSSRRSSRSSLRLFARADDPGEDIWWSISSIFSLSNGRCFIWFFLSWRRSIFLSVLVLSSFLSCLFYLFFSSILFFCSCFQILYKRSFFACLLKLSRLVSQRKFFDFPFLDIFICLKYVVKFAYMGILIKKKKVL